MQDKVPLMLDWLGAMAQGGSGFFEKLGRLETGLLGPDLGKITITKPVFVCGLARSGSTLLLEFISGAKGFCAHRYRDFPFLMTPVFWDNISRLWPGFGSKEQHERAHKDRIMVGGDSPEAFDEMLWMHFIKTLHDGKTSDVVTGKNDIARFAEFYKDHIKKILFLHKAKRFVSKNNYNLARIDALLEMFPDAHVIVPVRHPLTHVASLSRQHVQFCKAQSEDPRALRYMQRCGHFEFGLDFRPLRLSAADAVAGDISKLMAQGQTDLAYAHYWQHMHEFIAQIKEQRDARIQIVPYERLCETPEPVLRGLAAQLGLERDVVAFASGVSAPSYYTPDMQDEARAFIEAHSTDLYQKICS